MEKQNKVRRYEMQFETANINSRYAIQRIDLLTVSLGGALIYYGLSLCDSNLKTIGLFILVGSIVFNFLSQWTGLKANKNEAVYFAELIRKEESSENYNKKRKNDSDCWSNWYNKLTYYLNGISSLLLFVGLIIIVVCSI